MMSNVQGIKFGNIFQDIIGIGPIHGVAYIGVFHAIGIIVTVLFGHYDRRQQQQQRCSAEESWGWHLHALCNAWACNAKQNQKKVQGHDDDYEVKKQVVGGSTSELAPSRGIVGMERLRQQTTPLDLKNNKRPCSVVS